MQILLGASSISGDKVAPLPGAGREGTFIGEFRPCLQGTGRAERASLCLLFFHACVANSPYAEWTILGWPCWTPGWVWEKQKFFLASEITLLQGSLESVLRQAGLWSSLCWKGSWWQRTWRRGAPWSHHEIAGQSWTRSPTSPSLTFLISELGQGCQLLWMVLPGPSPLSAGPCFHFGWRRPARPHHCCLLSPSSFALPPLYFQSPYHLLTYDRVDICNALCLFLINSFPHWNASSLRVEIFIYFASSPPWTPLTQTGVGKS